MKKTIGVLAVMIFLAMNAAAQPACFLDEGSIGSIDDECQRRGFDYGIAKYQCGFTSPEDGEGTGITVSWGTGCQSVDWTADPAVDGVLSKEDGYTCVYPGGTSGTITASIPNPAGQANYAISHITFCGSSSSTTTSTTTTTSSTSTTTTTTEPTTTSTMPTTTTTTPNAPEFASISVALAVLLTAPAFAYLAVKRKD